MKKLLSFLLTGAICLSSLAGCGGKTENSNPDLSTGTEEIEINFPTSWVGVSTCAQWFKEREQAFNEKYKGKYKLVVEEIPGDQAYVNKMKVLYASDSLPDVIATGGYNLIDMMKDKFVDLTPYLEKDSEWKSRISKEGMEVNSRDGKLYGIPYAKQMIGYFYNKDLFQKAGIQKPAETWDQFFAQLDKLKAAGITPLSMDTADSGWVTSLMLGAAIAQNDAGEKFMNQFQPKDYNTPEFIDAASKIQKMFKNYTTQDSIGGKYENAASNFFAGRTAIIANGPWMVSQFYDTNTAPEGFGNKVGVAAYPGNVMYNSGKIGFNIAAKTPEKIEAALEFVKFITSDESQKLNLESQGDIPDCKNVSSDKVKPVVNETIMLGNNAKRKINDCQSLWYANVVDEISVQYPMLAQGKITPQKFASLLTDTAKKNSK